MNAHTQTISYCLFFFTLIWIGTGIYFIINGIRLMRYIQRQFPDYPRRLGIRNFTFIIVLLLGESPYIEDKKVVSFRTNLIRAIILLGVTFIILQISCARALS
jgi:hypothetical protein